MYNNAENKNFKNFHYVSILNRILIMNIFTNNIGLKRSRKIFGIPMGFLYRFLRQSMYSSQCLHTVIQCMPKNNV